MNKIKAYPRVFFAVLLGVLLMLPAAVHAADTAGIQGADTAAVQVAGTAGTAVTAETDGAKTEKTAAPQVNYTVVESEVVQIPGTERIVVSVGELGASELSSAMLCYTEKESGEVFYADASQILADAALFELEFKDQKRQGRYQLSGMVFCYAGSSYPYQWDREILFGIGQQVNTTPDAYTTEDGLTDADHMNPEDQQENSSGTDETAASVQAENTSGTVVTAADADMEDSILQSGGTESFDVAAFMAAVADSVDAVGKSDLVVVLDAGHGGYDSGAAANGLYEKNLTLKIASYCKSELEKYKGVKVYMTRSDDTYVTLDGRISYASSVHADVFVSLHINSAANTAANGAEVYYPNGSYRAELGAEGKKLADTIRARLVALGLTDRGSKISNSQTGNTYPDGSLADYYAVIRGAKNAGFPGIIVEHAFISNASDASTYLGSDAALKKIGKADAKGIAECYGLELSSGSSAPGKTSIKKLVGTNSSCVTLKWKKISDSSGYEIYRSTSKNGTYKRVTKTKKASVTSWQDKSVKAGKTYYYKVRAYKVSSGKTARGTSSAVKSVRVLGSTKQLSIQKKSSTKAALKWKKVNGASGYQIYRSTAVNGTYKKVATVKKTSWQDNGRKKGKTYYYKIRAKAKGTGGTTYGSKSRVA